MDMEQFGVEGSKPQPVIRRLPFFEKVRDVDVNIPRRQTYSSAGYDFESPVDITIPPGEYGKIHTGIAFNCRTHQFLSMHIRSSKAFKDRLVLTNSVGIIDADYYPNEIIIEFYNRSNKPVRIKKGDRVAQGIIQEYHTVYNDEPVERERVSGIGSTGE